MDGEVDQCQLINPARRQVRPSGGRRAQEQILKGEKIMSRDTLTSDPSLKPAGALGAVEQRGIEPVPIGERTGNPLQLFWVWFAANISVLGLPLGVALVAMGLSIWQAVFVAVVGSFGSFALVGLVSIAGRR